MFATMPSSLMSMFLFALPLASAMPWDGPAPTQAVEANEQMGWSPMPTPEPAALFKFMEIRKRASSSSSTTSFIHQTCGFLQGDSNYPLTCVASGYSCAVDTVHSVFACCSATTDCNIKTSCVPAASLSACDSNCIQDAYVAKCNPTSAFCSENILLTGTATFTNWFCTDFPTLVTQYATATDNSSATASYILVTQNIISKTSTSSSSTPSSTIPVGPSTITVTPGPTTTSATPVPSSKSTPTGAIAGGVVGGLAVIGAVILGIFCLIRRKRKQPDPAVAQLPTDPNNGYYAQPTIAEKEAPMPTNNNNQQGRVSELYSPPQSPAPQYSPSSPTAQPVLHNVYPNMSEMDAGPISAHAAPGSY